MWIRLCVVCWKCVFFLVVSQPGRTRGALHRVRAGFLILLFFL
jgi:hypothetical protein